jgi:hypothetical protein
MRGAVIGGSSEQPATSMATANSIALLPIRLLGEVIAAALMAVVPRVLSASLGRVS